MTFEVSAPEYWKEFNYQNAKLYCFSLNIEGKTGWRLPTIEELKTIITGIDCESTFYWSSEDWADVEPSMGCLYKDGFTAIGIYIRGSAGTIPVRDLKDN
jgi:hypothetical protein